MSKFIAISNDTGTSGPKVLYPKGRKIERFFFPSLIASGATREEVNGFFEAGYSRKSIDNIAIETDTGPKLVGNLAKRATEEPRSLSGIERYADKNFMETITLAALSETGLDTQTAVLTTAVPTDWYNQKVYFQGNDIPVTELLTDHYQRNHVINRIGRRRVTKEVNITNVNILTETKGLLYSFVANPGGESNYDFETLKKLRIVVVDIGEWTTCLDSFLSLEREFEGKSLTDVSMGAIHKTVATRIKAETGRDLQPWQVRDIIRDGDGLIYLPFTGKGDVEKFDIMPIYQEQLNEKRELLKHHLSQFIRNQKDVHYILIGGGGSDALGSVIEDSYRQSKKLGRFATAEGLYNYGVMVCNSLNR